MEKNKVGRCRRRRNEIEKMKERRWSRKRRGDGGGVRLKRSEVKKMKERRWKRRQKRR